MAVIKCKRKRERGGQGEGWGEVGQGGERELWLKIRGIKNGDGSIKISGNLSDSIIGFKTFGSPITNTWIQSSVFYLFLIISLTFEFFSHSKIIKRFSRRLLSGLSEKMIEKQPAKEYGAVFLYSVKAIVAF